MAAELRVNHAQATAASSRIAEQVELEREPLERMLAEVRSDLEAERATAQELRRAFAALCAGSAEGRVDVVKAEQERQLQKDREEFDRSLCDIKGQLEAVKAERDKQLAAAQAELEAAKAESARERKLREGLSRSLNEMQGELRAKAEAQAVVAQTKLEALEAVHVQDRVNREELERTISELRGELEAVKAECNRQ